MKNQLLIELYTEAVEEEVAVVHTFGCISSELKISQMVNGGSLESMRRQI